MKLRWMRGIIILIALLLSWLGFSYIQDTETRLLETQKKSLISETRLTAIALQKNSTLRLLLAEREAPGNWGEDLYIHKLPFPLEIDGYLDANVKAKLAPLRHVRSGDSIKLFVGTHDRYTYLYIEVTDSSIRYFKNKIEEWRPWRTDHIKIVAEDKKGTRRVLWVTPVPPDHFSAWYRNEEGLIVVQPSVSVEGKVIQGGYKVELRLPSGWIGNRLGVAAVDHDGELQRGSTGSMQSDGEPGRLIRRSEDLERLLSEYTKDMSDLQLSVVSKQGWLLAETGVTQDPAASPVPGSWILAAIYRYVMPNAENMMGLPGASLGRVDRDEVNRALGKEQDAQADAKWYVDGLDSDLTIVSTAVPLDVDNSGAIAGALVAQQSSAATLSFTNRALVELIGLSALAMIAIFFMLISYSAWLSKRIARLGRDADNVMNADSRGLGQFPSQTSSDELGDLGRSFGDMVGRVRGYTDYLQTLAAKLSHELRTPLAVVSSSMDNLETEELSPQTREYLDRARQGTDRLSYILNAMSAATRIEQSIQSSEKEPVDLSALVDSCIDGYRLAYPGKSIELSGQNEGTHVLGCPELLSQLLDKLMENACDFCSTEGTILVGLKRQDKWAVLTVENDGPELPAGMSGNLFESMVSVRDDSGKQAHMGLGLTIVRLIAEYHEGTSLAANRDDGSGVIFTVRLPLG